MYKYLDFNEGSLRVITEGTLKYTDPEYFNDPFDCRPEFDEDSALGFIDEHYPEAKRRNPELTKEVMIQNVRTAIREGRFHESPPDMKYGVLCLSRDPLNILMWSHYADSHRGFLVKFRIPLELPEEINTDNKFVDMDYLLASPVKYDKERQTVFWTDDPDTGSRKTFYSKSLNWEYEQEERIVSRDRLPGIYNYNRNAILCSIIAGVNMDESNFLKLQEAVDTTSVKINKKINLNRMRLERGKYGLLID